MAATISQGVEAAVTLATTVTRLTITGPAKTIVIYESDVDVYIVTAGTADGGALPSTGRPKFLSTALPIEYDISPFGPIGLAGSASGTCRIEVR